MAKKLAPHDNTQPFKGLIQVYTGDGKGKTTTALGQAMRAIGHDYKVCMIQFLKGGKYIGEYIIAQEKLPNFSFFQFGRGCVLTEKIKSGQIECGSCRACFQPFEKDQEMAAEALEFAKQATSSGKYKVVILDEINMAVAFNLLAVDKILNLIKNKHSETELILTGRDAHQKIIDAADLVTHMNCTKHPYEKGIPARRGIEY